MFFNEKRSGKSTGKKKSTRKHQGWARKMRRHRSQPIEVLEARTLLSLPAASINSVSIVLNPPGPTSVSGSLNPGDTYNIYQVDGTSGERLQFHSVSTTSTDGNWLLFGENGDEVAGSGLGSDFTANLTATGPYDLELIGNITGEIDYSFQVSDISDQPVATSGLGVAESGSLAAGTSTSFTFTASAGLPVYFNSFDRSYGPVSVTLTDPNNHTIFTNNGSYNEGPYVLTSSGTYTIALNNSSGSSGTYDFDMVSLPDAATSLALGPTQTVAGTLDPGTTTALYSFQGAAGENIFLDNQQNLGDPVYDRLISPDGNQVFDINSYDDSGPLTLTESGTYYLLIDGESSSPINYQFRLTDTAYSPLTLDTQTSGSFGYPTATDAYSFTGTAGERVTFASLDDSNGFYGASWALYGPNNQQIASPYYSENFSAALPADGNYTLVVYNYPYYGTSTYSFEAYQNVAPTSTLALGTPVSGTIVNPGDEATYTFAGTAGQTLYFNGLDSAAETYAQLTGPNGNSIFNQYISYDSYTYDNYGPFTLTATGTYSLTIYNSSDETGAYNFVLDDTASAAPVALTSGAGTSVSDSIPTGLSANIYQISGTAGENLYFQTQSESGGYYDLYWTLYGPTNQSVNSGYYWDSFPATLSTAGTYYLVVDGTNAGNTSGVSYNFEVYDNVNPTSTLTLGTPVSGTIVNPGDEATYTFTGTVGQTLYLNALDSDSGFYAELTNPSGNEIFDQYISYNYDTEGDYGPFTLSASGTYSLTINGDGSTGSYNFALDDAAAATPIALTTGAGTEEANQSLATGLSTDLYQISGTAGERLYFQAQGTSTDDNYDVLWTLYGPNDQYVAGGYSYYDYEYFSDFTATLPTSGNYLLVVAGTNSANTSGLTANFEVYDNVVNPSGAALTLGTPEMGTIVNPGDEATYTFTGSVGQTLFFDGLESSDDATYVELTNPYGNEVIDEDTAYSSDPFTLAYSGTYTVTVSGSGAATGPYDFDLENASAAPSISLSLGSGTVVNDAISTGTSANLYQFNGTAGELLYLQALSLSTGNSSDLRWTLFAPNGQVVNESYYWSSYNATLPFDGTYYLFVQGTNSGNTSGVSYSYEIYDNVDPTTPLTLGTPISGTIVNPGDEASYTFTGTVGQNVYFSGLDSSQLCFVQLLDPTGRVVFSSATDSSAGPFLLTTGGTYTLTVNGFEPDTGAYDFDLEDASLAPSLTLSPGAGTTVSDAIPTGASGNVYQISGTADEPLYFQAQGESGGYYDLNWTLYGPSDQYVSSGYYWDDFTATLATSGTYWLVVNGTNVSNTSGVSYNFEVYEDLDTTSALTLGTAITGTIATPGATASYTFTGTAGQSLLLTVLSADAGVDAEFDDPNGNAIFYGLYDQGPFLLSQTGSYTLTIFGDGTLTGNYAFALTDVSTGTMLSPTTAPATESGTITPGTGYAIYQFAGTAGETVNLTSDSFSSTSGYWFLVDPSENQVAGNSFGSSFTANLVVSGMYTLVFQGSDTTDANVTYSFDISATLPATVAESGLPLSESGSLGQGDSISFTFNAPAGLPISFNSFDRSVGLMTATLFDPNDNVIFSNDEAENDGPFILTVPGTYTLTLTADMGVSDPSYNFDLFSLADAANPLTLGAVISGTLNPGTTTAVYSFAGTAGQNLFLDNQQNLGDPVYLSLYDPYNNEILTIGSNQDGGPLTLTSSGTYYLLVDGESTSGPIDYQFRLTDTSTAPLAFDTQTSGSFDTPTAADAYSFTGTAGEKVTFASLDDSNGFYGASWALYGPNNEEIEFSYYSDTISVTLPADGNYTLVVSNDSYYGTSSYSFDAFQNVDPITTLTLGTPVSGTIANLDDEATYTFTGTAGQILYLNGLESYYGTFAELTGPAGEEVFDDFIGYGYESFNDEYLFTIPLTGAYSLTINNGYGYTGNYNFVVNDTSAAAAINLTSGTGTPVSDSLASGLAANFYEISGTTGEQLYFQAQGTSTNDSYDVIWDLYGPNGQFVAGYDYGYFSDFTAALPANGNYLLVVNGTNANNTSGVGYNFEVYDNVVNPSGAALTLGTPVTGTLVNPGDTATYTFTGTAGQTLFFNGLESPDDSVYVTVTGPYGNNVLYYQDGADDSSLFTLTNSGTYTVTVFGYGAATGGFDFVLDDTSTATSIALTAGSGTTVSDSIPTGLSANIYQISGTAGERLYFQAQTESGGYYDLYWTLYGPNDQYVSNGYYWGNFSATLPSTGTYYLVVDGTNAANTSGVTYNFEVYENVDPTVALTLGTPVSGTIVNPGDEATYTFTGTAGQTLYFNGLDSDYGTYAELYGPSGNEVFDDYISNNYYIYNDYGPFTLSVSGSYSLTIFNGYGDTGNYNFVLDDTALATSIAVTSGAGTPVSDSIPTGLSANIYQISGSAGERLYFEAQTESGGTDDLYWTLYGPNDQYVSSAYYWGSFSATLPTSGTYYLVVDGTNAGNTSGVTYNFEVYESTDTTYALTLGTPVTGTTVNPGDEATYTFTGTVGQTLYFNGLDSDEGFYAELVGPTGTDLFDQYISYDEYVYDNNGPFTLTTTGTYSLTIFNAYDDSGTYNFVLDDTAAATPIALTAGAGTPVSDSIPTGLSANIYQISGTAGERVYFQAQTESGGYYDLLWTLYGPNGQAISNNYWNNFSAMLPTTGTYYLVVAGTNANNTSGVSFNFEVYDNVDPTSSLSLNTDVTGTIVNPGDEASYTFTGSTGELIQFNGLETGSYLLATLYNPEGTEIFSQYMTYNAGPYFLSVPGTYTLVISGSGSTTNGDYSFQLLDLASQPKLQVNTTEADLTVTLSAASTQQILVSYSTEDDTATVADGDYKPATGVILFQPGQTSATVEVQAIDKFASTTTDFLVNLSNPVGATIASGQGTGTVTIQPNGTGTVSGEVFDDMTGDGTLGAGDTGISGVTVEVLGSNNAVLASGVTDSNGDYTITGIAAGTYTIAELAPTGYVQTAPASGTYSETLGDGETISGLNFGNFQTVTLGGEVYDDSNADGTLDNGESGLSGWTVNLVNSSSVIVATATTDGNGDYSFSSVGPGTYTVEEVVQSGYAQTSSPASYAETTASGQDVSGLDFGDFATDTLSGEVFTDTNGNGVLDSGEPGLSGVTVDLLNSSSQVITSVTTGSSGNYTFTIDAPGTYSVEEVQPSGTIVTVPVSGSYSASVTSGQTISDLNFGNFQTVTLSGEVYSDTDGNGVLNGGEPGLSGWTVDLVNSANQVVAATTGTNGSYSFSDIGPGTYTIEVVQQTGYDATSTTSLSVTASSGSNVSDLNFGEFALVTFSGEVYNDTNGNGTLNNGELGLSGWTVDLINSSNQVTTATTDVNGDFSFTDVGPGTYTVEVVQQTGYDASSTTSLSVTASSGSNVSDLNFGEFVPVALSGEVFGDVNGNGALDGGESGLSGWTVNLLNSSSQTVGTVTTDPNGDYSFAAIGPGAYSIQVVQQTGYVVSTSAVNVTTSSGQNVANLDVGEFQTVTISGEVFNDLNGDGLLDGTDSGLAGWTVKLLNSFNGVITTTTASDGTFSIAGVGPGSYTVEEVLPGGYIQTSSPLTYTGTTSSGQGVAGLTFGVFQLATVSGELFQDANQDGTLDDGESGLSGWTVNLLNSSSQVIASTTTDANGDYAFSGLNPGFYTMQDVLQAGYTQTAPSSDYYAITSTSGAQFLNENFGVYKAVSLAVSGLTTVPSTNLQSSESLVVEWDDTNTGTSAAAGSFYDLIVITNTTTGQQLDVSNVEYDAATRGDLAAGASAPQQFDFTLPNGNAGVGQIQFTVTADYYNYVSTSQGETNQTESLTETSTLAPYPDLVVSSITPPSGSPESGTGATIGFTVTNQGDAAADGSWQDDVYIENVATSVETYLGELPNPVNLAPGADYQRAADFTLPQGISGSYEIVVTANANNGVFELDTSNNTSTSAAFNVSLAPYADLQVPSVTVPQQATAGQSVTISWTVTNDGTGATDVSSWEDSVYISTSTTLDSSAIYLGEVQNPTYLAPGDSYSSSLTATLPSSLSGPYYAIVNTNSNNAQYEYIYGNNNVTASTSTFEINPAPAPAFIHVQSVAVVPSTVYAGQTVTVNWTDENTGGTSLSPDPYFGYWDDGFALSQSTIWDGTDGYWLGGHQDAQTGTLAPGQTTSHSKSIALPQNISGTWYLIIVPDTHYIAGSTVDALGSSDVPRDQGYATIQINLPPEPDLVTTAVTATPTSLSTGDTLDVGWTVTNDGFAPTDTSTWTDSVYLLTSTTLQIGGSGTTLLGNYTHNGTLIGSAGYTVTNQPFTVPEIASGSYYVFVVANSNNAVFESNTSNDIADDATPVQVTYVAPPLPDLEVASITPPINPAAGQTDLVGWTVTNDGAGDTGDTSWTDEVILSSVNNLNTPADQTVLGASTFSGDLPADKSYSSSSVVTFPTGISGTYYLFVVTDYGNTVVESNETNNASSVSLSITATTPTNDLQVTAITPPQNPVSGQSVNIGWTVTNTGTGDTGNTSWTDEVILSSVNNLNVPADQTVLGSSPFTGDLAAGQSYNGSLTATLPQGISGTYYLFVITNFGNTLAESNETNDTRSVATTITLAPPPDLQITSLGLNPTPDSSGQALTVNWTVTNNGQGATPANQTSWTDQVYLSTLTYLDPSATLLGTFSHDGALAVGGSYNQSQTITLPQGISGSYTVFVVTNADSAVYEGTNGANNDTDSAPLTINLTPPPDLQVQDVQGPTGAIAGQSLTVSWTVVNNGTGQTVPNSWYDSVYLSRDQYADPTSIYLGSVANPEGLGPDGASYNSSLTATLPASISGAYYIVVVADSGDVVYEGPGGHTDNVGSSPTTFTVTLAPLSDLTVSAVTVPVSGVVGQSPSTPITWTVNNIGGNPALGTWTDAVYLSPTPTWEASDPLVALVTHTGEVDPGDSYTGSTSAALPAVAPGNYYVIVRANIKDEVHESDLTNNELASTSTVSMTMPTLTLGVQTQGTIANGQAVNYEVNVQAGQNLVVTTKFTQASAAEFFVRYGAPATLDQYDEVFTNLSALNQQLTVSNTHAGSYFILLDGEPAAASGSSYTITATTPGFSISSVSPSSGSNKGGTATVAISGLEFEPDATVSLIKSGVSHVATQVWWVSSDTLWATFNLTGLATGSYNVQVKEGGQITTDSNAFTVNTNAVGSLAYHLITSTVRPGGTSTVTLAYSNTGYTDIPAPLFTLSADIALLQAPGDAGFNDSQVELLGINPNGPAGILPPGFTGQIVVNFQPTLGNGNVVNFEVGSTTTSSTSSVDWSSLESSLQPDFVSSGAWAATFANFTARAGSTLGQFVNLLDQDATYLSQIDETTTNFNTIMAFEFAYDEDSLPSPTLITATDVSSTEPGLALTLSRSYGLSIDGRYASGPFGIGWDDPWDVSASVDAQGDVDIQSPGSNEFFSPLPGGGYAGEPGDYATLTEQYGAFQLEEADGTITAFLPDGQLDYIQDLNGNRITAVYSGALLTSLTQSNGDAITFQYNNFGLISEVTDPEGRVTDYTYDSTGQYLLSVTGSDGTTSYQYSTATSGPTAYELLTITNPGGTHEYFTYNSAGQLTGQSLDGGADATTYSYVAPGEVQTTDGTGDKTSYFFDQSGLVVRHDRSPGQCHAVPLRHRWQPHPARSSPTVPAIPTGMTPRGT